MKKIIFIILVILFTGCHFHHGQPFLEGTVLKEIKTIFGYQLIIDTVTYDDNKYICMDFCKQTEKTLLKGKFAVYVTEWASKPLMLLSENIKFGDRIKIILYRDSYVNTHKNIITDIASSGIHIISRFKNKEDK